MVTLEFPFDAAVTSNRRLVPSGRGQLTTSARYREAKRHVQLRAMNQYRGDPLEGELWMVFRAWMPDRRRRDVLNLPKVVLDGLEGIVYEDDVQVGEVHVVRSYDPDDPRVRVEVGSLDRHRSNR